MADWFVDDGGDNSAGTSWATAYTSIASLVSAQATALTTSGNRIFIGDDHNDSVTGANRTFTGPTSGLPVLLISCDRTSGTNPPAYKVGTGDQLKSSDGTYALTLDGSFALYGIRAESGGGFTLGSDFDETCRCENSTIVAGANGIIYFGANNPQSLVSASNITIDLTSDGTANRSNIPVQPTGSANVEINGLSFVNAGYRTGSVIAAGASYFRLSGADFSGFTNATACELVSAGLYVEISNSLTAETWVPVTGTPQYGNTWAFYNVGPADAPTYLYVAKGQGTIASSSAIYRTGGATVEGDATAWLITTTAECAETLPLTTPWIYGLVSSTGSKTFDLYITNDTADFTDAEVWLEVEYLATADEAQWALAKDQRATITTTAAAQTDDTTSTWNGTGPAFTYKQKLSVTAVVNETGQYRARVCVGVASIASSRYTYLDPRVFVS